MCCDEKTRGPRNFLSTTELLEQNQELEELYPNIDDIKDATAKTYISLMKQQGVYGITTNTLNHSIRSKKKYEIFNKSSA